MSRKIFFAIAAGAVGILLAGVWIGRTTGPRTVSAAAPEEHVHEAAETVWTCSMDPQVRQPEPGDCPICGMDLIPLQHEPDSGSAADLPRLSVSERSAALMNIQTWPAERRAVEREVRLAGTVAYDERRLATISARVPGRLERLYTDFTGAEVGQGEPLVELFSPALISAQEELLQAIRAQEFRFSENEADSESPLVNAARDRLRLLGLTEEQLAEIENAGEVMDRLTIRAPMSGTVVERQATQGNYVETGDPLYAIADLSEVWVNLEAYASDLAWLEPGQAVTFSTEAFPGEQFEGTVDFITPTFNETGRTARVRVSLPNPERLLKPGMFVRAVVSSKIGDAGAEPLVIPASAPLITGKRAIIYIRIPHAETPTFEAREIVLGPRAGPDYVVADGLDEGELVVTRGSFKIDSELQIRGRPSMMASAEEVLPGPGDGQPAPERIQQNPEVSRNVAAAFSEQVAGLTGGYLETVDGLAADDAEQVREALRAMRNALGNADETLLSGEAQTAWNARRENLTSILNRIGSGGLERTREHLQELTVEIEKVHLNFGGGPALHRAYCPMVDNNAGATWLQLRDEINNPYFGASMLRCGEIVDVLEQPNR